MKYYFIGIKGNGMSSLSKILVCSKEEVFGCDYKEALISEEYDNIDEVVLNKEYIYIIGNAFFNHDLSKKIIEQKYKYFLYKDFIQSYFKNYYFISICGSHGKTQTTKLLSTLLDSSIALIGDGTYKYEDGAKYFIIESCEYRNTFLAYKPNITLVLNVDYDHVDFFKTKEDYENSFIKFINQSETVVINKDDTNLKKKNAIYYSYSDYEYKNGVVKIDNKEYIMPIKGEKFANNFVGVYKILKYLNIDLSTINKKLKEFKVARRRFQCLEKNSQILILDYAHHYAEIKTTYEMIKENYPNKKIICIFEPHTISRLNEFLFEYKKVLNLFDEAYLHKLFTSVREKNDEEKVKCLYKEINKKTYDKNIKEYIKSKKDVVIAFLGAGNIDVTYNNYLKNK